MGVPGNADLLLLKQAAAAGRYQVQRSIRYNASDSAFLSRTPASAGNRKTWTWSGWVKLGSVGTSNFVLFNAENGTSTGFANNLWLYLTSNQLYVGDGASDYLVSNNKFRDPSAWYHIVLSVDTTQSTASNKMKLHVNGSEITYATDGRSSITTNSDTSVSSTFTHYIGRSGLNLGYFDGYLADIYFIDGQALTPSSFGEFDATTGVWNPKTPTGLSYGTNGYHLDFADNSNNTATTLGKDTSGNGNNWTPNNLSVTAGAGNDSLVDSPTNGTASSGGDAGGVVVGNYCTLNPLDKNANITPTNGNLDLVGTSTAHRAIRATVGMSSGKWYWEATVNSYSSGLFGIAKADASLADGQYVGANASSWGYLGNGNKYTSGSASSYGASFTTGDVIGIAFDADNGTLTFYKNGTSQGSAFTGLTSGPYFPAVSTYSSSDSYSFNFGARVFSTAASSGFKSLNTANLPASTILKGSDYFQTVLYTGNGSTQTISGLGFSPDLVWCKVRGLNSSHNLWDVVRGARIQLQSNTTNAEYTESAGYGLTAFNSDGFSLGLDNQGPGRVNSSGEAFAAWCWDAGSSNATNTSGSITSTVRANASAGFSIATYSITGASSTISTFGHGLGVAPEFVILKVRNVNDTWTVYHKGISNPTSNWLTLNATDAAGGGTATFSTSSTTFGVRETRLVAGGGSGNILAYLFTGISGYSSAFSYTGNGSADGPAVYLGFRPRLIIIKRTDSADDWNMFDTARSTYNVMGHDLLANRSDSEYTGTYIDALSNGFKVRETNASRNASGGTYIGYAFAENCFSIARAR